MAVVAGAGAPKKGDLMSPGFGMPADGKYSSFYHYPGAVTDDKVSPETRDFLQACMGEPDKLKDMIASGIDVQTSNIHGASGLHIAAWKRSVDCCEALIEANADVNAEDCNGETPLDKAMDTGLYGDGGDKKLQAVVTLLESNGAMRKTEAIWIKAYNQAAFAPNA
eukprot:gnl/TRDRNA2_/TRDRNA2_42499_c0_seq1.p1 gnl/TRDRNA2_/TRDRNA2_42499_c0~~gnl/TRDRNA2_/TRDRNA2_42499_c0_seq1.p1  ORF type:complete len:166 (+),score=50.09 gnl/TRDRNA2_/TRDRNA2_42499_c0_seq1:108-605(+)